jgi:hypothetical protein
MDSKKMQFTKFSGEYRSNGFPTIEEKGVLPARPNGNRSEKTKSCTGINR